MMLGRTLVDDAIREALTLSGRPPTGEAASSAASGYAGALHAALLNSEPDTSKVSAARVRDTFLRMLREGDGRNWPAVPDLLRDMGVTVGGREEDWSDAPASNQLDEFGRLIERTACTEACRRGVLEWRDQHDCAWTTACVCAAGRWVRSRTHLTITYTDPVDCRRRGWRRQEYAVAMSAEDIAWIHERMGEAVEDHRGVKRFRVSPIQALQDWKQTQVPASFADDG